MQTSKEFQREEDKLLAKEIYRQALELKLMVICEDTKRFMSCSSAEFQKIKNGTFI